MNNNIQVIDDAFVQMMNYELYQQATVYEKREAEEMKKEKELKKNAETQRKMEDKKEIINQLREENMRKAELFAETKHDAEELTKACSGKLENLPLYRNYLDAGNYILAELKEEREQNLIDLEKELEDAKEEKQILMTNVTNYRRDLQLKKDELADLTSDLQKEVETHNNSERILSRIILMLKRLVPLLVPDKKDVAITIRNMERYMALCGLSLEQKATILSYRNRSFPIESINEDTTLPGQTNQLKSNEAKEENEENKDKKDKRDKKDVNDKNKDSATPEEEECVFLVKTREIIKDKKIDSKGII